MALLYRMGTGNGSGSDIKPYTVNFECASGYIGQTLTMTYKGTPHAGEVVDNVSGTVGSDGTLTLYPMHSGEWECSCYSSVIDTTMKKTIDLSYWGVHPTVTFEDRPNGATVTPTDDVQTWLHCANVWNKSYTTISEVVADTTTLNTLIANENANDYLVRSTTFATDICSNESAMTYIGLNDYCANKLLANSTWLTAICNADEELVKKVLTKFVPTLESNTGNDGGKAFGSSVYTGYGNYFDYYYAFDNRNETNWIASANANTDQYVGYQFPSPVCVRKVTIDPKDKDGTLRVKNFIIQASKDNVSGYENLYSGLNSSADTFSIELNHSEYYSYYRLFCTDSHSYQPGCRELQFYGR